LRLLGVRVYARKAREPTPASTSNWSFNIELAERGGLGGTGEQMNAVLLIAD
jgi:hypothetical protein